MVTLTIKAPLMTAFDLFFPQNIQLFMSDNQGGEDVTQVKHGT